ncbi:WD40 repeat domain-containing protein [Streptomyces sp. NPDC005900]|uniref:WD40 repeat domain-containing protein n=1 Tax=Streptomyces sp. NPDC005900 TaxID=3154569 RepID=UPI0033EADC46
MGEPFGHVGSFYSFGPGDRMVLEEREPGGITLWDTKRQRVSFEQRRTAVSQWAISPDDRLLALCSGRRGPVRIRDLTGHRKQAARSAPWPGAFGRDACDEESSLRFAPDSRALLALTANEVRVWDLDRHRERTRIRHKGLDEAAFSPDGRFIAATDGEEILLWRTANPTTPVLRVPLTNESATQLRFDVSAGVIRYLSELGSTELAVRTVSYGAAMADGWSGQPAAQAQYNENGRVLALERRGEDTSRFEVRQVAGGGRRISRTPAVRCERAKSPYSEDTCRISLAVAPDGATLAYTRLIIDSDGNPGEQSPVTLWDVRGNSRSRSLAGPGSSREDAAVVGLAFTRDGRSLLVRHGDDTPTETWDVSAGRRMGGTPAEPPAHETGAPSGAAVLRSFATSRDSHPLAVRPDGRLLVAPGQTVTLPSGRTATNRLADGEIGALAFSPDGEQLAAGTIGGRVALWDGEVKQNLGSLAGTYGAARPGSRAEAVTALAYSPDGRTLAVAGDLGTLQLWDAASRRPLGGPLPTPGDAVLALAFSPDGRTLHTAGERSAPRSLPVDPKRLTASVCARAGGGLSRADWHKYIPEVPYRDVCPATDGT